MINRHCCKTLAKIITKCCFYFRFLDHDGSERDENKFCYVPFGAGRHRCIGESFAYVQNKTIWSVILEMYEIELVGDFPEPNYQSMIHTPITSIVRYKKRKWDSRHSHNNDRERFPGTIHLYLQLLFMPFSFFWLSKNWLVISVILFNQCFANKYVSITVVFHASIFLGNAF